MLERAWLFLVRKPSPPARRPSGQPFRPRLESLEQRRLLSADTFVPLSSLAAAPQASQAVSGLTPAQVRHAYGFDQVTFQSGTVAGNGSGQTIAIVDAYDDPSIGSDLTTFDQQFGLPAPYSFSKVGLNASGQASATSFPTPNAGWAGETELDVEWAHAIAPGARILLVEANSASLTDLLGAVNYARQQSGVVAVSMSWGMSEFSGEGSYDSTFSTPAGHAGVTFFGASGDDGSSALWPALSAHVVAVGGTSLSLASGGAYGTETSWAGSGGGRSTYLSTPGYQQGLTIHSGTSVVSANGRRTGPDVSYDANPYSGFAVYGTYGWGGWAQVGGTSAAVPQWAALTAIADQGRALAGLGSLDGVTQTLPALYTLPASDFHDVTAGSNRLFQAGAGYDLVTGRGSPLANLVIRDLVGSASTTQAVAAGSGGASTARGSTVLVKATAEAVGADSAPGQDSLLQNNGALLGRVLAGPSGSNAPGTAFAPDNPQLAAPRTSTPGETMIPAPAGPLAAALKRTPDSGSAAPETTPADPGSGSPLPSDEVVPEAALPVSPIAEDDIGPAEGDTPSAASPADASPTSSPAPSEQAPEEGFSNGLLALSAGALLLTLLPDAEEDRPRS